ncbi:predicted protein [Arabidopsis lyrata subsp. lyrata]|uniref:Predicted protein n=1 Tax=Arabidopsis lyrata subsp. lyrata TaxID=81972 RepID=D7MLV4_ARALL|nr:predicted protein [Arabidopsis lyrata subsp. lyrata]
MSGGTTFSKAACFTNLAIAWLFLSIDDGCFHDFRYGFEFLYQSYIRSHTYVYKHVTHTVPVIS